jgi:dihydropteroate synthase
MSSTRKTRIMGVLNVTPDSFSDGGLYYSHESAIARGLAMLEEGADIIDVGPISTSYYTNPDKKPVPALEQIRRIETVIPALLQAGVKNISIDSPDAAVARVALDCGATWVNDQTAGLGDEGMAKVMAEAEHVVLMHGFGLGFGVDAAESVKYLGVMDELKSFFTQRIASLVELGVAREKMLIDPGFGFGKGLGDSLTMLTGLSALTTLGVPILVGLSRKSFIGKACQIPEAKDRDYPTIAGNTMAVMAGADVIRTHNVRACAEALKLLDAALNHNPEVPQ